MYLCNSSLSLPSLLLYHPSRSPSLRFSPYLPPSLSLRPSLLKFPGRQNQVHLLTYFLHNPRYMRKYLPKSVRRNDVHSQLPFVTCGFTWCETERSGLFDRKIKPGLLVRFHLD